MIEVIQYTVGMSNGFFIRSGAAVIAVDSGGELGDDILPELCPRYSIPPRDISLLIVTHGHVDHFLNMGHMKTLTRAPILCHKQAERFLSEGLFPEAFGRNKLGREIMRQQEKDGPPISFVPTVEPDIVFEGEYDLNQWGIGGKIIETPGHSKCSTAIILDSGEAIVGDTIVQPPGTDTAGLAFLSDTEDNDAVLFASIRKILDSAHTIYSGHGGPFPREAVEVALKEEQNNAASSGLEQK